MNMKERVQGIPVCIVIPPSEFLADERVFPFLGPLKVAAELRRNDNPVDVLDLSGYSNPEDIIREYVRTSDTVFFGLTATTPQIPTAVRVRNKIREMLPEARIILGGPHVTLTYAASIQDEKLGRIGRGTMALSQLEELFDRLVVGDGETAIFTAIDPEHKGKTINAGDLKSPFFMRRGELDSFDFPARDLIDMDSYHYEIEGNRAFSVIAQLGCPFECGFCGGRDSQVFRMTRTRSTENVIAEIEQVIRDSIERKRPYSGVMFYDDELNIVPSGLENLCKGLMAIQQRLGMEMRFRGFVKAELFTPEQAKLMYQAGFKVLLSGVESGSDAILQRMRKHTSAAINTRCLQMAHDAGLKFKALMSMGHPGESRETINESIEWVLSNKPDDVDWTIITQYPGSPYFDRSVYIPEREAWCYLEPGSGEILWSRSVDFTREAEYYKGIPGNYTAYVWTDYLSSDGLVQLRDEAERITRSELGLKPISSVSAVQFEHSMGQGLTPEILRRAVWKRT